MLVAHGVATVFYSTDGGATWITATVPAGVSARVDTPWRLGSGVVLRFGRTTSSNLARIFRSTDSGQTYVTHALIAGAQTNRTHTIRALTPTILDCGCHGTVARAESAVVVAVGGYRGDVDGGND